MDVFVDMLVDGHVDWEMDYVAGLGIWVILD
jgi:hypothetical protein